MGRYIENSLVRNEEVIHQGLPSIFGFPRLLAFIAASLLAAPLLHYLGASVEQTMTALGAALVGVVVLRIGMASIELAVTNRRVLAKSGLIRRTTSELYLNRIEGVEVVQGLAGRVLGFGTVRVRGTGDQIAEVRSIRDPLAFRKAVFATGDLAASSQPSKNDD